LIDVDGNQLGVVSRSEALDIAADRKLDLVKIAPTAKPPVCKIMDYGKFKYEQSKKEKESKKKQKMIQVKEIRLSINIDSHDMMTKANNVNKFLKNGDKVKGAGRGKGRKRGKKEGGEEGRKRGEERSGEDGKMEQRPRLEGRSLVVIFNSTHKA